MCFVEGLEHALVYNWNGDNAGPSDALAYAAKWKEVQQTFPNAKVCSLITMPQHMP